MSFSCGGCWLACAMFCATMSRVMDFKPPKNPMHGFRVIRRG